ncbi:hypothetical protein ACP70R_039850 [Stipagrostis hirtigluma subsp. patula]
MRVHVQRSCASGIVGRGKSEMPFGSRPKAVFGWVCFTEITAK